MAARKGAGTGDAKPARHENKKRASLGDAKLARPNTALDLTKAAQDPHYRTVESDKARREQPVKVSLEGKFAFEIPSWLPQALIFLLLVVTKFMDRA